MKVSKVKKVCNLILLDASGSMQNRKEDLKGGVRDLISTIKSTKDLMQQVIICDFSDDFRVLLNTVDPSSIDDKFINEYTTRGATSLFDAIAKSFDLVPSDFDGVFVNIVTDGEENSSRECNTEQVKKLIASGKESKWGITFMGCDEAALDIAKNIGINNVLSFANTHDGYKMSEKSRGISYSNYVSSVMTSATLDDIQTEGLFAEK